MRLLVGALLAVPLATVCRYTVRDIGFVSLVTAEWSVEATGPVESQAELRLMEAFLLDANVTCRVQPSDDLSVRWFLVSQTGERLDLGQATGGSSTLDAVRSRSLGAVLNSPLRTTLTDNMFDVFATVLFVRGTDRLGARAAQAEIDRAIELLHEIEPQLPRPLAGDVVVALLLAKDRNQERVTLWALGLNDLAPTESAVVMIYGRMKRAGKPLTGERLIAAEILTSLALIGESCECDTDRDWASEPRLPHRFDAAQHELAAATLGFDPDSPYVLAEVTRILSRGSAERTGIRAIADLGTVLFGYREGGVSGRDSPPVPREKPAPPTAFNTTAGGEGDWGFPENEVSEPASPLEPKSTVMSFRFLALIGLTFLCLCIGAAALVISIRGRS